MKPLPPVTTPHPHVELRESDGSPMVRGTPVPVRRLWAWHKRGISVDVLLKRYPTLGPAKVLDALSFAFDNLALIEADLAREQEVLRPEGPTKQLSLPREPLIVEVPTILSLVLEQVEREKTDDESCSSKTAHFNPISWRWVHACTRDENNHRGLADHR